MCWGEKINSSHHLMHEINANHRKEMWSTFRLGYKSVVPLIWRTYCMRAIAYKSCSLQHTERKKETLFHINGVMCFASMHSICTTHICLPLLPFSFGSRSKLSGGLYVTSLIGSIYLSWHPSFQPKAVLSSNFLSAFCESLWTQHRLQVF